MLDWVRLSFCFNVHVQVVSLSLLFLFKEFLLFSWLILCCLGSTGLKKPDGTDRGSDMKRRNGNPEMDTRGSPERFPGPTDRPLCREGDTVVEVPIHTDSIPGRGAAGVVGEIGITTSS